MAEETCGACGTVATAGDRYCMTCGRALAEQEEAARAEPGGAPRFTGTSPIGDTPLRHALPSAADAAHRYHSLRLIATIFTVLAWVVMVLGGIGVILWAAHVGGGASFAVLVGGGIELSIDALSLFAAAAFIRLMVGIEENTRITADMLLRQVLPSRA